MRELLVPAVQRVIPTYTDGSPLYSEIHYNVPDWARKYWQMWAEQQAEKNQSYDRLYILQPFRPRTTGKHSQCNHINGHVRQVCYETGDDFDTLKTYFKRHAIKRGYPYDTDRDGIAVPWSEARISTVHAAALLDELHQWADEHDFKLIEGTHLGLF